MGNLSGYGIYKLGGGGGGSANTIYNADDTIGSGRVATITDTLQFQSVSGGAYGGWIIKPALIGAGDNEYASISYGADTFITKYRANQAYAFGTIGNTTNNFDFNTGINPNFSSVATMYINGGSNTNALHLKGGGSTSATTTIKAENSLGVANFNVSDDGLINCKMDASSGGHLILGSSATNITTFTRTSSTAHLLQMNSSGSAFLYIRDTYSVFARPSVNWKGVKIGGNVGLPDASSMFELEDVTDALGFLMIRNTDPNANITSPANGLMAYDSTDDELQYYNGTSWISLTSGGGSSIYSADGNILTGVDRVATIDNTATLTFAGASASGDFVIKGGHATAIQSLHTDASGYNFFDNYQLTIRTNISGTPINSAFFYN